MNSDLYLSGTIHIYGNTATSYAPGIYNGGNLYVQDTIKNPNGVYIENENHVIKITEALTSDAMLQLDSSNYIIPDETKAPIVVAIATDSYPILTGNDLQTFRKPVIGFENWVLELYENNTKIVLVPHVVEEYTITYLNLKGAVHQNPTTYTSETPTFTLTPPSYVKCQYFVGWYNQNNELVKQIPLGTVGDLVFTARWENIGSCKIGYVRRPKRKSKC